MDKLTILARKLRKTQTSQEQKIWNILRRHQVLGLEFRRQYPIGDYIVDFVCRKKKLIIEIDGGQHNQPQDIIYDQKRTEFMQSRGYRVLRFWNNEIDENLEGVYDKIIETINNCGN